MTETKAPHTDMERVKAAIYENARTLEMYDDVHTAIEDDMPWKEIQDLCLSTKNFRNYPSWLGYMTQRIINQSREIVALQYMIDPDLSENQSDG